MWAVLLSGVVGLMLALGFGRFAYTPMVPIMMEQAHLSVQNAGLIASFNYLGYTVGALTPLFWKRSGARAAAIRWGIILTLVGFILMSINYPQQWQLPAWSIARFLNGVGSGWLLVNISSVVLQRLLQVQRLELMGWLYSGVGLGSLLSAACIVLFERWDMSWYREWGWLTLLACFLSIPVWIYLTDTPVKRERSTVDIGMSSFSSINIRPVWYLGLAYACKGFSYIIVMTFLPVMSLGLGVWAENAWLLLLLVSVPSTVLWGWLSEHYGNIRSLQIAFLMHALGVIAPVIVNNQWGVVLCALLVGSTFMGIVSMSMAQAQRIKPQATTLIIALVTTIYSLGQMLGPGLSGIIAQRTDSFSYALIFAAVLMCVGWLLLARLRQAKQQLLREQI